MYIERNSTDTKEVLGPSESLMMMMMMLAMLETFLPIFPSLSVQTRRLAAGA